MLRPSTIIFAVGLCCSSISATALAHPLIEQAEERYAQADFDGALDLLAEAEAADDLERADVVDLLVTRALVNLGAGEAEAYEDSLRQLATLEPDYRMGPQFPPHVREQFETIREESRPLELTASAEVIAGAVRVQTQLSDPGNLVRRLRIGGRDGSTGPFQVESGRELEVPAAAGATVQWYAEAIGPGGAVVARVGSPDEPRTESIHADLGTEGGGELTDEGGGGAGWIVLGVVAGLLVAGAVVAAILFATASEVNDETTFGPPMIQGF